MRAVTVSADLDSDSAERMEGIATAERRSVPNLVAAIHVFMDLPKGVRDALEAGPDRDPGRKLKLAREMEAIVARDRFDRAAATLAAERRLDPAWADLSEIEVLEEASATCLGPAAR